MVHVLLVSALLHCVAGSSVAQSPHESPAIQAEVPASLLKNASPLVGWLPFETALDQARKSGKKVIVDIFAASCGWCRRMQEEAYSSDVVLEFLKMHFETARLDIEVVDDTVAYKDLTLSSGHLSYGFGATGTPTTVFLMPNGDYITRLPGYAPEQEFLRVLRFIATDAFLNQSFEEFSASLDESKQ